MASLVYALCALISAGCAVSLVAGYRRRRNRLFLWSGVCFTGLFLNNVLLFVDLVLMPRLDLSTWRALVALGSLLTLLYGLVWEPK